MVPPAACDKGRVGDQARLGNHALVTSPRGRILEIGPATEFSHTSRAVMSNTSGNDLTLRAFAICRVLPTLD